jgi:hypothetical protein
VPRQATPAEIEDEAIHEVVREVFAAPEYNQLALAERFWGFAYDLFSRIVAFVIRTLAPIIPESGLGRWLLALLILTLVGLAVWLGLTGYQRREIRQRLDLQEGRREAEASIRSAEELATRGLFTEAAHALYAALLGSAAAHGHIHLHHSKTIGDYVRELRRRAPSLFARFREFARNYEYVIYGTGQCDRHRYEQLRALALPLVQHAGGSGD